MPLHFSKGNTKLKLLAKALGIPYSHVVAFDIPAGYTCPAANLCKAYAVRKTGRIIDGPSMQFRCYAASIEALYPSTRAAHWRNFDLLRVAKTADNMTKLILQDLPKAAEVVRIHSSGDFFNEDYWRAWTMVAHERRDIKFFGYTKVLPWVLENKPNNIRITYSWGGKWDQDVIDYSLDVPTCYVVQDADEAERIGVPAVCYAEDNDVNDFFYIMTGMSFAIPIHGTQPKKDRP